MSTFPMDAVPNPAFAGPPGISVSRAPGPLGAEAQPPGLWQAPGFSASSAGLGGAAAEAGRDFNLQKEISGTIENQVARLIEQARHDTESKVKMELKQIVDVMKVMDGRLDHLLAQLDGMDPPKANDPPLDAEQVNTLLSKIEQQWGQEIRTLKQELHQTILAHNHNADLIKHHKDTIDALRDRCTKLQKHSEVASEIQQQLQRLDQRLKQQQKQRKLEPLFDRLTVLEQKVATAQSAAYRGYPGMSPMVPPGVPGVPPGVPPGIMPPGIGAPSMGATGKGAGPKGAGMGLAGAGASGPQKQNSEKAAFRCPTDEEVQARLSKLSQAQAGAAEVAASGNSAAGVAEVSAAEAARDEA